MGRRTKLRREDVYITGVVYAFKINANAVRSVDVEDVAMGNPWTTRGKELPEFSLVCLPFLLDRQSNLSYHLEK